MIRALTIAQVVWLEMLRRKDFFVLLILLVALLFVLMSANVFGLGSAVRYVMDVGLLLSWLFSVVLAVSLVGRQLPGEEERGTIYPLLAKPITRAELLLGKWLGGWTAVAAATVVFYAVLMAVVRLRGGEISAVLLAEAWMLHVVALGMVAALALALSTRMSYGAAATLTFVLVAASYTLVPRVPELLTNESGLSADALLVCYYALPHFELYDLRQRVVHGWGPLSSGTLAGVLAYGVLVTAIFLLLAWWGYRGKRFRRGGML